MIKQGAIVVAGLLALAGCGGGGRVVPVPGAQFGAAQPPEEVHLFHGDISRPYRELAWIDTDTAPSRQPEAQRTQLEELRRQAARIGADAVIQVQSLEERRRGAAADDRTPFAAWEQSQRSVYFLRGKAVRYLSTGNEKVLEREEERAGMILLPGPSAPAAPAEAVPIDPAPEPKSGDDADVPTRKQPRPGY